MKPAKFKVLFIHPMVRVYRRKLFEMLAHKLNCTFLLTETAFIKDPTWGTSHMRNEAVGIIKETPQSYLVSNQLLYKYLNNFSFDIFKQAFNNKHSIVIYSCMTSVPFVLTSIIARLTGKKIIIFDELWRYPYELPKYKILLPIIRFLLRYTVDAVITAGTKAKQMYINDFGIDENKIFVAYNTTIDMLAADMKTIKLQETQARIQDMAKGRSVVLYLGRLVQYKGLDVLIESFKSINKNACLVIVGQGTFLPYCESLVDKLDLTDRVFFMGGCNSDESIYYYKNADIFVLPTRFFLREPVNCESWGYTLNEAMSLEVPVVATTAVGAAFDLIQDGVTGMIARENDPIDLSNKINSLLNNDQLRKEIGSRGRRHLMSICDYDKNYESYVKATEFVLSRNSE